MGLQRVGHDRVTFTFTFTYQWSNSGKETVSCCKGIDICGHFIYLTCRWLQCISGVNPVCLQWHRLLPGSQIKFKLWAQKHKQIWLKCVLYDSLRLEVSHSLAGTTPGIRDSSRLFEKTYSPLRELGKKYTEMVQDSHSPDLEKNLIPS